MSDTPLDPADPHPTDPSSQPAPKDRTVQQIFGDDILDDDELERPADDRSPLTVDPNKKR